MSDPSAGAETPWQREIQLKICGLQDPDQAQAIAALGVDAVGVVAVPGSPRFLPMERRGALFASARHRHPQCLGVLVVADPTDLELPQLMPSEGHQVVQLHGEESPERCKELRSALGSEIRLWKALRLRSQDDLVLCEAYGEVVDGLLLDAWAAGQLGGTGRQIPLCWLQGMTPQVPWWLAGGIKPETVESILHQVRPFGLDASSGVEDRPGWKNIQRVEDLLQQVKGKRKFPLSS